MSLLKTSAILTALFGLSAGAFAQSPVQVYTYDSFAAEWGAAPKLKTLFEQQTRCKVNFVAFDDGITLFNRLRLEGRQNKADIILGLDNHIMAEAEKTGLFTENNADLSRLSLPVEWQNRTFLPYDFAQYAFIYDKNKLSNPPESLKELVNRRDLKVIYQDPRTSTIGRGLLLWINSVYPQEQTEQAWKTLAQHTVTVGKGWSETYGAFLKGESDLVLSSNTSPLYHRLHEQNNRYAAANFAEGGILQIEVAAKLAGKNNPCSDDFLSFLLTPEAQKIIVRNNIMLSVISAETEPHFDALKQQQMKTATLNTSGITSGQIKQWLQTWQKALTE